MASTTKWVQQPLFKQVGFLLVMTEILHNFLLLFFLYFSVLQMQCSKYYAEIYTAMLKAFFNSLVTANTMLSIIMAFRVINIAF